jgi:hypothetical protein
VKKVNRFMGVIRVMIVKEVDGVRTVKATNGIKVATGFQKSRKSAGRKGNRGKLR